MIRAVNTDFGLSPVPPQVWFAQLAAFGYAGFITPCLAWAGGAWAGAGVALDRALTAGRFIATYARPPEQWEVGLKALGPDIAAKLQWFEPDVEPHPDGLPHPVTDDQIDGLVKSRQRPVIYAYAGEFVQAMGYDPGVRYATIPLHDRALRATLPTGMGQSPLVPFAGWNSTWTRRKVWQCRSGVVIGGIACDVNVVDGRWL